MIAVHHLQGTATTSDATLTDLFTLPAFPADGSFTVSGTVIARAREGDQVTAFFPVNSGSIVGGVVSQSAAGDEAAPCPTAPSDGGMAQGFAPQGCSTLTNGLGQTMPLRVRGLIPAFVVAGGDNLAVTWSWDLTLVMVTP